MGQKALFGKVEEVECHGVALQWFVFREIGKFLNVSRSWFVGRTNGEMLIMAMVGHLFIGVGYWHVTAGIVNEMEVPTSS